MSTARKREAAKPAPSVVTAIRKDLASDQHRITLARLRYTHRAKLYEHIFGLLHKIIGGMVFVAPFYLIYLSIGVLINHGSAMEGLKNAIIALNIREWLPWVVAAMSAGGYIGQKRLRERTIAGHQNHTRELEERIDPQRSSSGLSNTGKPTNGDTNE